MDGTCSSSVREDDTSGADAQQWQFAYREALSPCILRRVLLVVGIYLGSYATMCPLGTGSLPWVQRLAYFSLCSALCTPLCHAEYVVTLYLTRHWTTCRIALAVAAYTLIAAPTSTAVAYGVDTLFRRELSAYGFPVVYLFMTLSVLLCTAVVHYLVVQRVRNETAGAPDTEPAPGPASPDLPNGRPEARAEPVTAILPTPSKFLDRVDPEIGRDIIFLKMSDHYVEVVTAAGRCAILMRFADAVAELGGKGIRVHRSYWVAYRHVNGWARRNQRPVLRLDGDHVVPVSRTYLGAVRAALDHYRATGRPPSGHA